MSDLDTTQTVRAVTTDELYDSHRPKWYAIQLVVSAKPVNLDMMPRLEAFAAHRLYAVVGKQGNVNQFALRLGFFPDLESARALGEGLANYFSSPSVVRVSAAEHARFAQAPRAPVQKPVVPSVAPVARPSAAPVARPSAAPVARPSAAPVARPRAAPVARPSAAPVARPSTAPVARSSDAPVAPSVRATAPAVPRQKLAPKPGAPRGRPRTLGEELLEEAREVHLARSGKHRPPAQNGSWLARLFGGPKR